MVIVRQFVLCGSAYGKGLVISFMVISVGEFLLSHIIYSLYPLFIHINTIHIHNSIFVSYANDVYIWWDGNDRKGII